MGSGWIVGIGTDLLGSFRQTAAAGLARFLAIPLIRWDRLWKNGKESMEEVKVFTWLDVLAVNGHMRISVWACVLMPETNDVAQFMYHNAKFVTVFPNGDSLRSPSSAPHIGTASAKAQENSESNGWHANLKPIRSLSHRNKMEQWRGFKLLSFPHFPLVRRRWNWEKERLLLGRLLHLPSQNPQRCTAKIRGDTAAKQNISTWFEKCQL